MFSKEYAIQNNYDIIVHYYVIAENVNIVHREMMNHNYYDSHFRFKDGIHIIRKEIILFT